MTHRWRSAVFSALIVFSAPLNAAPGAFGIASAHPAATEAGLQVLRDGGNAFDAAIAVSAMLGVVEPQGSGIGGGGFFLLHTADNERTIFLDARERAPLAAHRDMYLGDDGQIVPNLSLDGPLAAGIPGIPAAWAHLTEEYAQRPLSDNLTQAIATAREGFEPSPSYIRVRDYRRPVLEQYPASAVFLAEDTVRLPDLADTLEHLAEHGAGAFYQNPLADKMVTAVRTAGGIWQKNDLTEYRVIERNPIRFTVPGAEVITAPLPSASGIILAQVFQMVGGDWWDNTDDLARRHRLVEALRRAYLDRAEHLGDPQFTAVPVDHLISAEYANTRMSDFNPKAASQTDHMLETASRGSDTTHFSILDAEGNWVSATLSVNTPFGSGFVVPETGIVLNNEMDDFSATPGVPNTYGLIGSEANAIEPGKRMLSSMAPTAVIAHTRTLLLGSPGGSRITTTVLQGILAFLEGDDVDDIVSNPRFHHQALPDQLEVEADLFDEYGPLQKLGHKILQRREWSNLQAVLWDRATNTVTAASDPRGDGEGRAEPAQR